jgi:hypothetical protein
MVMLGVDVEEFLVEEEQLRVDLDVTVVVG